MLGFFYFMEKEHLYTDDLSEFLGRSSGAIRNLVMRRAIPYRKVGGRLMFIKSEIKEWIENSPGVRLQDLEKGC